MPFRSFTAFMNPRRWRSALDESYVRHGLLAPGVRLMRNLSMRAKMQALLVSLLVPLSLLLTAVTLDRKEHAEQMHLATQAVAELRALAALDASLVDLSRAIVLLEFKNAPDEIAAAAQVEEKAFADFSAAMTGHAWFAERGYLASAMALLEDKRSALRNGLQRSPPASQTGMTPRIRLLRDYQDELAELRRRAVVDWAVVADAVPAARALFEGGVLGGFEGITALSRATGTGMRLLSGAVDPPLRIGIAENATELRLVMAAAEPRLLVAASLQQLDATELNQRLATINSFLSLSRRLAEKAGLGAANAAEALRQESGPDNYIRAGKAAIQELTAIQSSALTALEVRLKEATDKQILVGRALAAATFLGIALSAYLLVCAYQVLQGGLTSLRWRIERLGRGELADMPPPLGRDEVGQAIGTLQVATANLRNLFDAVTQGVSAVSHASREVANGNAGLSSRTGDMRTAIGSVTGSAQRSSMAMDECAGAVEKASEHVQGARADARHSSKAMAALQERMRALQNRSREINQVVTLMQTVSFQTKLLSLNASVEAARAGAAGKGFAVVAQEVRALATRSEQAAAKIRTIVGASVQDIEHSGALAAKVNEAVRHTDQEVQAVNDLMAEVVRLTREGILQSQGLLDVARTVEASVAGNVQLIDQLSSAAGSLRAQGDSLKRSVRHFALG